MREPETELTLEAPAGLIDVTCQCRDGKVLQVKFRNVPAFVQHLDAPVEVPALGTSRVDVAYGGMHYALVDAARLGFRITPRRGAGHLHGGREDPAGGPGAAAASSTPRTPGSGT